MTTHQIANAKENRISESQLHSIIKESVKEVLGQTGHADGFQNAVLEVMDNIGEYMMDVPLVLIKGRKRAVVKFAGKTEDKIVKNRGLDIHVTQWTIKMGPRYYNLHISWWTAPDRNDLGFVITDVTSFQTGKPAPGLDKMATMMLIKERVLKIANNLTATASLEESVKRAVRSVLREFRGNK